MSSTSEPKIDVDALMALMPVLDERGQRRILAMVERVNQSRREKSTTSTGKALIRPRPTTDDELHEYIREECGYDIPRVAVCNGHQSPFSFVADAFFERYDALFQVGSRELGKTLGVSVVNYVNAETRPGCTSCTFGAIESQAQRAYDHVTSFVYVRDRDGTKRLKSQMAGVPLRKKTEWKTGSKIEIIVGSESGVNSPHPHKVHADEVDLMAQRVWNQAQPLDALVATPTGWSQMGDLSVGDLVIGSDGRSHIVLAVHEHGEKDVYRVDLTDGRSTECCGDHLWQVSTKSGSNRVWSVQKTEHLLHKLTGRRADGYPRYRYRLPMPAPVSYDGGRERRLPLDPYVL